MTQQRNPAGAKVGDELPLLEIFFRKRWRDPVHGEMKSEVRPSYQLQKFDRPVTKPRRRPTGPDAEQKWLEACPTVAPPSEP